MRAGCQGRVMRGAEGRRHGWAGQRGLIASRGSGGGLCCTLPRGCVLGVGCEAGTRRHVLGWRLVTGRVVVWVQG
jgi:hypothetical protein